jgi:hypothetical protein
MKYFAQASPSTQSSQTTTNVKNLTFSGIKWPINEIRLRNFKKQNSLRPFPTINLLCAGLYLTKSSLLVTMSMKTTLKSQTTGQSCRIKMVVLNQSFNRFKTLIQKRTNLSSPKNLRLFQDQNSIYVISRTNPERKMNLRQKGFKMKQRTSLKTMVRLS